MKKLLILMAVLLFASGAFGQSEGFEVWYGGSFSDTADPGTWNNVINVCPDEDIDIPVYALCLTDTTYIANFCLPLGINTDYIDHFNSSQCELYYPLTEWDDCTFTNMHCNIPFRPGWCSLSIIGFADTGAGPNPWGYWYPNISHIATYSAHTINSGEYIYQTVEDALDVGRDPFGSGGPNAGDTGGQAGWNIYTNYIDIYFEFVPGYSSLSGTVTDIFGAPLGNIHIEVDDGSRTIIAEGWTDSYGSYSIFGIPVGNKDLIFSHIDYVDTIENIRLHEGNNYLDMIMWPNAEEDVVFWFGNLDDSPLIGAINQRLYMNVYMQNTDDAYGGDIHVPFAVEDQYIEELLIDDADYFYPFTEWDSAGFDGMYSSPPNPAGWSSISFFAETQTGSPWLHFKLPSRILTFGMKIVNDSLIIGDTVACIGIGAHPDGYPFGVADTLGSAYASVEHISEVAFVLEPEVYNYRAADINMYNGTWPPLVMGSDVTYLVNYFSGSVSSLPCMINGFWCSADVNGDCIVMGSDVVRLVNHFKGIMPYTFCPDYPAAWYTGGDCPDEPPPGWPACE